MRIQHNIPAMSAYRNYTNNVSAVAKNLEKLSSGYRINRAGDDAAGLAISEKMRAQISGLEQAQSNAKSGINLVQTAEGALTEVHDMLNRMYTLAEQSRNGTYDDSVDRCQMQKEIESLKTEIDRISEAANFNGIKLLDGSLGEATSDAVTLQSDPAGINLGDGVTINAPKDGAGIKEKFEVTFSNENGMAFGAGDTVSFKVNDNGTEKTLTFNFDASTEAGADPNNTTTGKFTGATFDDQIDSLVAQLNATGTLTGKYTAEAKTDADGNKVGITFTADSEAVPTLKFVETAGTGVIVTDKVINASVTSFTPGADAETPAVQSTKTAIKNLLGPDTLGASTNDLTVGDTVKFKFSMNGEDRYITLTAAAADATVTNGDKTFQIGATTEDTTTNLVNALKTATFDKDDTTPEFDASQIKFSDIFDATANNDGTAANVGSIMFTVKDVAANKNNLNNVVEAVITHDGTAGGPIEADDNSDAGTDATGEAAVAESTTYTFQNTFSKGDKVSIGGTLSDGRRFEVTLTAADTDAAADHKFAVGSNLQASISSISTVLQGSKITVVDADGTKHEVDGSKIFSTGNDTDFKITANADNLVIANNKAGVAGIPGATSRFGSLVVSSGGTIGVANAEITADGAAPGKAENIITFDRNKIEDGTAIEFDGKKYEFVSETGKGSGDPDITAIVVANLNKRDDNGNLAADAATNDDIALAFAKAINPTNNSNMTADTADTVGTHGTYTASLAGSDADGKVFDVSVKDGAVILQSQDEGTAAKAIDDIKMVFEDERDVTALNFNSKDIGKPNASQWVTQIKAGDTIEINGKTYEFLLENERTSDKDYIGVDLGVDAEGLKTMSTKDVVEKLAEKVSESDTKLNCSITKTAADPVNKTGEYYTLSLTKKFDAADNVKYAAPEVTPPKSSNSLTLQIGDTAESFNEMKVTINACDTENMGISGIDISTQEGAKDAMEKIKEAINYVSDVRGTLGATQNRLDHTINNLSVMQENIQDAESTIRDVDVAKEMMAYTKNNILVQSAQAMLAQANQLPQGVLQLLG